MKFMHSLSIVFAYLPGGNATSPNEFNFFYIFPPKSLDLDLIPGVKLPSHWAFRQGVSL